MPEPSLAGRWTGHYSQHGREFRISTELTQAGDRISGSMRDDDARHECSVFEIAAMAGLPPGADEQIVARLRALVPDEENEPIRYVSVLPPESKIEGRVRGRSVTFVKSYQGATSSGYRVGKTLLGEARRGHWVHYEGTLTDDGQTMEGVWRIDADPALGCKSLEGSFRLQRSNDPAFPSAPATEASPPAKRPWWKFWK